MGGKCCDVLTENEIEIYVDFLETGDIDDEKADIIGKVGDHIYDCTVCDMEVNKEIKARKALVFIKKNAKKITLKNMLEVEQKASAAAKNIQKAVEYFSNFIFEVVSLKERLSIDVYPAVATRGVARGIKSNNREPEAKYNETLIVKLEVSLPENAEIFLVNEDNQETFKGNIDFHEGYSTVDFGHVPEGSYNVFIRLNGD